MSDRAPRWEPGRNPVHRLLQSLDVLAVAFNRFRQCSFRLPAQRDGAPADPDAGAAYLDGANRLRDDLNAVRDAVCQLGEWGTPARFAERLADEAVAAFTRRRVTDDDTRRAVAGVAQWVGDVLAPWFGAVRPWNDSPEGAITPDGRRPVGRFEIEAAALADYRAVRRALLAALATAGETVPSAIDRRAQLAHHSWPRGDADPVTQDELLALARATDPDADRPRTPADEPGDAPTPPAGTPPAGAGDASTPPPGEKPPAAPAARPTLDAQVDAQVARLKTVPPPGLDPEMAAAYTAVAVAVRECARLQGMLPALWADAAEYRRLTAAVHGAADAARAAYDRIDVRLRRAGGPNVVLDVLNDVLTIRDRAPLDPPPRPGWLNAVVTRAFETAGETFPAVDGRGVLDRMLDQLARVPPAAPPPTPERAAGAVGGVGDTSPRSVADGPVVAPAAAGPRDQPVVERAERRKPTDEPDGPFGADGFRFAGVEVRFGRAGKQYRLVTALWDARANRPAGPRPVDEVIVEVWGEDNATEDSTFRQLCADTRRRLQAANCPLDIRQAIGTVQLSPAPADPAP